MVSKSLRKEGWKVVRIWECEIEKGRYRRKLTLIKNYLEISRLKK